MAIFQIQLKRLIVKPSLVRHAKTLFCGRGIDISDSGKRHLGSAIGSKDFVLEVK